MYVLSCFTDSGLPKIGLSALIKIIEIPSGTIVVNNKVMAELSNGFYYYDFDTHDNTKDYAVLCDGSTALTNADRYMYSGNDSFVEDIVNGVWNEPISDYTTAGTFGKAITESSDDLKRVLGLLHENIYIDLPSYDSDGNMEGARVRIYSDADSVGTEANVIGTYDIVADGDGSGKFTTWKQVKI